MLKIIEYKDNEEYVFGDVPGILMNSFFKTKAPRSFSTVNDAIHCLYENGNREDIELVFSDESKNKIVNYKGKEYPKDYVSTDNDDSINSTRKYFEYVEKINDLKIQICEFKEEQDRMKDKIRKNITNILVKYDDYNDFGKIELTEQGLLISIPVRICNDYEIMHKIDTELFHELNELIGVNGKLNISNTKHDGKHVVYIVELIYEL